MHWKILVSLEDEEKNSELLFGYPTDLPEQRKWHNPVKIYLSDGADVGGVVRFLKRLFG